ILTSGKVEWVKVYDIAYQRHQKEGKPPSLRVEYLCGFNWHREWVCFEHTGFPRQKAVSWWLRRAPDGMRVPDSVAAAIPLLDHLRIPTEIAIRQGERFVEVMGFRFDEEVRHG
ncbi:MAG: DNA helicase, partial [Magnetococcales bacterium]|nr:DNA helicase [Magnetococcales bacterium]